MHGTSAPNIVVLAGPNGAGKSTTGPALLRDTLGITKFVNADTIARGLSAFAPEGAAIEAGRVMLRRIHELADERATFAFETTLASRTFAPWLAELSEAGYHVHVVFGADTERSALKRLLEHVRSDDIDACTGGWLTTRSSSGRPCRAAGGTGRTS